MQPRQKDIRNFLCQLRSVGTDQHRYFKFISPRRAPPFHPIASSALGAHSQFPIECPFRHSCPFQPHRPAATTSFRSLFHSALTARNSSSDGAIPAFYGLRPSQPAAACGRPSKTALARDDRLRWRPRGLAGRRQTPATRSLAAAALAEACAPPAPAGSGRPGPAQGAGALLRLLPGPWGLCQGPPRRDGGLSAGQGLFALTCES